MSDTSPQESDPAPRPGGVPAEARRAPALSVILPAFQSEAFIGAAIESVLAQTFGDFELLIHDDGSRDATRAVAARHAARDGRIRLSHGPNEGLIATLNRLVGAARADILARMDADDICYPDRFARQMAFLDAHPGCVAAGGWTMAIDAAGREIAPGAWPRDHAEIDRLNMAGRTALVHPAVTMRKSAILEAGLYKPAYPAAEDLDLWLRMAETGTLANLPALVLKYREHDKSVSTSQKTVQAASMEAACRDAAERRGEPVRFDYREWRMDDSRTSRRDHFIGYGWDAWNWGNRDTWRHYALKAVRTDPTSLRAWKLLALGALRRPPKGRYVLDGER